MKKIILLIMDGIGFSNNKYGNAFFLAKKPTFDKLLTYPHSILSASEESVGLPKGQMGNSEVGHLNIGSGRIVFTGLSLINKEIENMNFFQNESFLNALNHCKKNNSKLHITGLFSNGGVHSSFIHINALLDFCISNNINTVLHCISDGRDVNPKTFLCDLKNINEKIKNHKNIKIGSISGRYYAMDRDQRWDRIQLAYDAMTGNSKNYFNDLSQYILGQYNNNLNDEFILPASNIFFSKDEISIQDNDSIIMFNFRPDRSRQMAHTIFGSKYYDFLPNIRRKNLYLVTMMKYEGINQSSIAYPPLILKNVLGEVIEQNNLTQLRIAETEKYAHVTFFFDGGMEKNFKGEKKILIPSSKIATYDLKPEMSAEEITNNIINEAKNFDFIIANYANGDMVGHTGKLDKTIYAIEFLDKCLEKLLSNINLDETTIFITSDHGNADEMLDSNNEPITKHSLSPVFFISTDRTLKLKDGNLSNIAPTLLEYKNINIPKEMTSNSLIERK